MSRTGYVVESRLIGPDGEPGPMARVYVETEERAKEIASGAPGRTYRAIAFDDMPELARTNMERAIAEKA